MGAYSVRALLPVAAERALTDLQHAVCAELRRDSAERTSASILRQDNPRLYRQLDWLPHL